MAAAHPIPKIAILPLVLIVFGIGETSKIVLIAVAAFFPMLINTMAGCDIHPRHFEVAKNHGAGPLVFRRVLWPGSLPLALAGARLALNTALVITVAVELLTARQGLGATSAGLGDHANGAAVCSATGNSAARYWFQFASTVRSKPPGALAARSCTSTGILP